MDRDSQRERQDRLIATGHELAAAAQRVIAETRQTIKRTKDLMRICRESRRQRLNACVSSK
jgi:hypothetical protein